MKYIPKLILPIILLSSIGATKTKPVIGFNIKEFEKSLVFIPMGSFNYRQIQDDSLSMFLEPSSTTVTLASFYMCNHEVSNLEYREFVNEIKKISYEAHLKALPDTSVWARYSEFHDPYSEMYFRHKAFDHYPVVGVTHEQAEEYCKWLTKRYASETNGKFKDVEFKLPTTQQWTYAAGGKYDLALFPWKENSLQNAKGDWMANFKAISQHSIGYVTLNVTDNTGTTENKKMLIAEDGINYNNITEPVISFNPNSFGIYNLAGNVEEYINEIGITKGGSWNDSGFYLQNFVQEKYDSTNSTSAERGFRFIMEFKK